MKTNLRSLTIAMGVVLALAIVFSQLFHYQLATTQKSAEKTEKQEEKKGMEDAAYTVLTSFSIPVPATIELDVESSCLFEIIFEKETEEKSSHESPRYTSKLLQHLFRVIISPNAP